MDALYQSIPLTKPAEQIRLLRWQPPEDPISNNNVPSYELSAHDCTGDWPAYVAISYTWGDSIPLLPIHINGVIVQVRMNCWHALWQLRHHQIQDRIWIDSICINQTDNTEKSAQVTAMAKIYKTAMSVAACLGQGSSLNSLQNVASRARQLEQLEHPKGVLDELEHLPYFDRLWIKQEIILAREVTLFCGPDKVPWSAFDSLVMDHASYTKKSQRSLQYTNVLALCNGRNERKKPEGNPGLDLVSLLRAHGQSKCQDPRDKIYGLLSLLSKDDPGRKITPDYARSNFDLFRQIVFICSEQSKYFHESGALPVLFRLAGWLQVRPHESAVLKFMAQRRQALTTRSLSASPAPGSLYARIPIVGFNYLTKMNAISEVQRSFMSIGIRPAGLAAIDTSTRGAEEHDPHLKASRRTTPWEYGWQSVSGLYASKYHVAVSPQTQADDILAWVYWAVVDDHEPLSCVVLRRTESESARYELCSWGILSADGCIQSVVGNMPSPRYTHSSALMENMTATDGLSHLSLHREDALAFVFQGLYAFPDDAEVVTTPANMSHAVLSSKDQGMLDSIEKILIRET
ncbi:hypothetical protein K491DRAFT_691212 [Lophiostoma macrostomum CBS 122681]|uniref:Heterokaryon incompatibility domain-containing protein n=1 Tax=Lophiostoma macrostomum CBS 122681 TaxID=1314788 RepID=A0A6A6TBJ9_9PLEO|nr:hypothetical protein K491DRAFT_691212 [Lophiostoma macrostomum CBS 122681]